jgi:hypothetical protein
MRGVDEDELRDAPPPVIGAVALGVAPLPFLAVYAVLFITRGTVHPVVPPDIGNTKHDELIAGIIALVAFVVGALATYWFLDHRRRWLFVLFQAALLGVSIDFTLDSTTGSPAIPILLAATSLIALVLAFVPASWAHMHQEVPTGWRRRSGSGGGVSS